MSEQVLSAWSGRGISVSRFWRSRDSQGPDDARHPHSLELCLIEDGHELEQIEGRSMVVGAGQYIVIPPDAVHSGWTEKQPCRQSIIHVPVSYLAEAAHGLGTTYDSSRAPIQPLATTPALAGIESVLRAHTSEDSDAAGRELLVTSLLTHLSVWLVQQNQRAGKSAPPLPSHVRDRVRDVEALMRGHLDRAHNLDDLAGAAGLSRFHFLRRFKVEFGVTPHAHLLNLRVEAAARLLSKSEMSSTAIALELGFSSASGLNMAFKKVHGATPQQWRARAISSTG